MNCSKIYKKIIFWHELDEETRETIREIGNCCGFILTLGVLVGSAFAVAITLCII
jgi:uncharacterized ferredoxin-like protein